MFKQTGETLNQEIELAFKTVPSWKTSSTGPKISASVRRFVKARPFLDRCLSPLARITRPIRASHADRLSQSYRELFASVIGGSLVVKTRDFNGTFEIDSRSEILRRLLVDGEYEPSLIATVKRLADPTKDMIDVGANVGLFTVLMSNLVSKGCRVLAIEPTPGAFNYLRRNITANCAIDNVIPFNGAATEFCGEVYINLIPGMEEYSSLAVQARMHNRHIDRVSVAGRTLDSLVDKYNLKPGFIKIDTEGAEHGVLAGAIQTIRTYRPIILSELVESYLMEFGHSINDISRLLKHEEYHLVDWEEGEALLIPCELKENILSH